jgi:hypothetical protein
MFLGSKIKIMIMAAIYVLHITFFDILMSDNFRDTNNCSITSASHQRPQNKFPAESSYRLLVKHDQAKQILVNIPDAIDFVSGTFSGLLHVSDKQPLFGALAQLNANTFKLYRLYRVFLI